MKVFVMVLEVQYKTPREDCKGWAMVDTVFESLKDCQKFINKEFDEHNGFVETTKGHYKYQFKLDRPLEVLSDIEGDRETVEEGSEVTIMIDEVDFVPKGSAIGS